MDCMLWAMSFGGGTKACNDERHGCILRGYTEFTFESFDLPPFFSACPYKCKERDAHWVVSPGLLHTLDWFFREYDGIPGDARTLAGIYPRQEMVLRLARHGSFFGFSLNPMFRIAYFQKGTNLGPVHQHEYHVDLTSRVLIKWGKFLSFLDVDVEAQGPQYVSEFAAFVKQAAYSYTGPANEFQGMDLEDKDDEDFEPPRRWITVEGDVSDVYCDEPYCSNGELGNSCMNEHDSTVFYDDQGVSLAALWQDKVGDYNEGYELRARAILWKALRIDHNGIYSVHLMDRIYAAYPEDRRELELWADRNGYERRQDIEYDDDDDGGTFRGWPKTSIFPLRDVPRPGRLPYMDTMFHLVCYEEHDSPGIKYCLTNDIGFKSIWSSLVRNHLKISKIINSFELRETNGHSNLNIPMQSRCDNCGTYEDNSRRILFDVSNAEHLSVCNGCYSAYQTKTRSGHAAMRMPHCTEEEQVIATRLTKVGDYLVYARRIGGLFQLSLVDHEEIEHLNVRAECPFCGLLFSNLFYYGEDGCPACYYDFYKDPEPDYIVSDSIAFINTLARTRLHNAFRR